MDSQQNNNPWADRLLQVSMPDNGEAWMAMSAVLDREMPTATKKDWRRWLLLILLLLLLIGVCHCPGTRRSLGDSRTGFHAPVTRSGSTLPPIPLSPKAASRPTPETTFRQPTIETASGKPIPDVTFRKPNRGASVPNPTPETATSKPTPGVLSGKPATDPSTEDPTHDLAAHPPLQHPSGGKPTPLHSARDTTRSVKPPGRPIRPAPVADSPRKKSPPSQNKPSEKEKGWMAGIGLNQLFPIGGQQSPYNSSGITGSLSDYLLVPMLRYYFSRKWYVQLEAQFNTPQAAKKDLLISAPPPDSLPATQQYVQHSTNLRQLFYFNMPLSLHYIPVENLNVGAGLQFSHLTDAIGDFDSSTWNINGAPDTVNVKAVKSLKSDTLYQKIRTNEFRFLFDVSYTWQRFIIGVRYNQALSRFIQVQIAPGQLTQSRNSSLQLYIRYILWDGRRNRPTGSSPDGRSQADRR